MKQTQISSLRRYLPPWVALHRFRWDSQPKPISIGFATATTIKSQSSSSQPIPSSMSPRASIDGLDQGELTEGHELPSKWKVAKQMVGRRLSQAEAKKLLANFA